MEKELIVKAKQAKTPKELMALAKECNTEMTEESAKAYLEMLHPKTGEMSDDELDNVAGGGCHTGDGRLVVTATHNCRDFRCKKDGAPSHTRAAVCTACGATAICNNCKFCSYEKGLWRCSGQSKN